MGDPPRYSQIIIDLPEKLRRIAPRIPGCVMLALTCWLLTSTVLLAADEGVAGTWRTADGRALIEIYPCGANMCGRVAWLLEPNFPEDDPEGMAGKPRIDRYNPHAELRNRRVLGLRLMEGFIHKGDNRWEQGTIYDADTGRTYRSRMTLLSADRLKLHGYIGIPLFGKSSIWTRQK
ncbi:MAG: DUF2147 domain-containing protein [Deltaproteobacteria bacterium]|nr:DUF2147 domain-containing protein [Deltaproteobacteria bacterium]TLN04137.1 MAG: DUF2147 domain-containing protein [bacterium]